MSDWKEFVYLKLKLEAIKSATNNFSNDKCIGKGGFGPVYKGEITHSKGRDVVAIKRLKRDNGQGDPEFWQEIMMLSVYKHENIVSLLGYYDDEKEKILVYEYAPKGSLDRYINSSELSWVMRLKICIGVARGLAYLHSGFGAQQRVLHRDMKSQNILLDDNWNAKISDFGLSKLGPANQNVTFLVSNGVGTIGYVDPLYLETGLLTKEADVYSFGVVLFEVLCGRLITSMPQLSIKMLQQSYEQNTIQEHIYGNIKDGITASSLGMFTTIAYKCIKKDREERPLAIEIVRALETALDCQINGINLLNQPAGILDVKVLKATNLERVYRVLSPKTYVKLRLTKEEKEVSSKLTKVVDDVNPEWDEEFSLFVKDPDKQDLEIVLIGDKEDENQQWINVMPLKDLTPEDQKTHTLDLFRNMNSQYKKSSGQIMVEITYKSFGSVTRKANEVGGGLVVTIHEGRHLELRKPIIYLNLHGDGNRPDDIRQTMHAKNKKSPIWNETFEFNFEKPPHDRILSLHVYHSSWLGSVTGWNDFLGSDNYIDINLSDILNKKHINEVYRLKNSKNSSAGLRVELKWKSYI